MLPACNCCNTVVRVSADRTCAAAYCDRCEVAYLEFKLRLLIGAYRQFTKKADEV
jgi:hypothetical protein